MVTYTQLINGLSRYIDNEIINKLTGNSKLLLGIGSGIALKKGENIYKRKGLFIWDLLNHFRSGF